MKYKFFLFIGILLALTAHAQIPQQFAFQGVARDVSNKPVANKTVSVRFTLHQGSASGAAVYQEIHTPQTTANGTFNVAVGAGNVQSGAFANIHWSSGTYFLQVELDAAGGSNYLNVSTSQLQSVPYALMAKNLEGINDPQEGDMMVFKGDQWQKRPERRYHHNTGFGLPPSTAMNFLSVKVQIQVNQANPILTLMFSKAFGSVATGGGTGLTLNLGYRRVDIPNQPILEFDPSHAVPGFRVSLGTRLFIPFHGVYQTNLEPGTYEVGMVGFASNATTAANWNDGGLSLGTVTLEY
ncbi:hypothetical protein [Dyadobacter fermentans]|uniref:Uncharacterized protein n=1 Tax=Dyadobacter fermentans (strain ATCC 700827 / DSM 18053 / CIP 107007 / KCTC 52180 / NS114) TaxID=471854 RepID=C6VZU1_DYAFD|nr:hypothetical protein [Dyadobacter fermentans]ACT93569.1 hypothetical protein Dfer_2350 [Dyadobacter fermentans DSM 18053]